MRATLGRLAVWMLAGAATVAATAQGAALPIADKPTAQGTARTKWGSITVEAFTELDGIPRRRVVTPHYDIYTELTDEQIPALEIGKVVEAAGRFHSEFTGCQVEVGADKWRVEIFANADRYRWAAQADKFDAIGGGRYMWHTETVYLYWQPAGTQFTRGLILHECAHQFHHKSGVDVRTGPRTVGVGSARFDFMVEGYATFFEGHRWNPQTDELFVGAPHSPERARAALQQVSARQPTFADMVQGQKDYPEVWGIMHYLVHRHPTATWQLLQNAGDPEAAWMGVFGSTELPPEFVEGYKAWLQMMAQMPEEVYFTSWKDAAKKSGEKTARKPPAKAKAKPPAKKPPKVAKPKPS